uniref:Uncharacterized protein n=1 Tax=Anopheles minimus TaxID=112268 RepID=A0A182W792_9DIPT
MDRNDNIRERAARYPNIEATLAHQVRFSGPLVGCGKFDSGLSSIDAFSPFVWKIVPGLMAGSGRVPLDGEL